MSVGTPLRYPGGKQKLYPFVKEMLEANDLVGADYAEAYCGGAGVAIALLLSRKVRQIFLNDSSRPIYAFWRSILSHPDEFCKKISLASLTMREWDRQREVLRRQSEFDLFEVGFATFFLNRCNRSGILSGGVIGGRSQEGRWKIDARFPRNELIRRVEAIAHFSKYIRLTNLDAELFIRREVPKMRLDALVYCDPPYFDKADRLYLNSYTASDHVRIAKVIQRELCRPWLVSYDNAPAIAKAYRGRRSIRYALQYNANLAYKGSELFIISDGLQFPSASSIPSVNSGLLLCA
jgi:DNA adenine methylase